MRHHPRPRARGFSLIELLVVIGLLTVLVAVLLPAVRMTRLAAQTSTCLSNVRQVGVLLNAYLAEHDGRLPALQNRATTADPLPAMDTVLLRPGDGAAEVMRCPADEAGVFEQSGTSYLWNFTVNGQRVESLFSIIGGSQPSRVPLVSDKEGWHEDLRDRINVLYADGHARNELTFADALEPAP